MLIDMATKILNLIIKVIFWSREDFKNQLVFELIVLSPFIALFVLGIILGLTS